MTIATLEKYPTITKDKFSKIIEQLKIPGDDRLLEKLKEKTLNASFLDIVQPLTNEIKYALLGISDKVDSWKIPFLYIFLAHCGNFRYQTGEQQAQQYPEQYIRFAIAKFRPTTDPIFSYNEALSRWYYGLLSWNSFNLNNCRIELGRADQLLKNLENDSHFNGHPEDRNKISILRSDLAIQILESQKEDATEYDTPLIQKIRPLLLGKNLYESWANGTLPFISSSEPEVTPWFEETSLESPYVTGSIFSTSNYVSASPKGDFTFDDDVVQKTGFEIPFDETKYRVFNIRERNLAAPINIRDSGNYFRYPVAGNSMNQATPVPIETGDYILVDTNISPTVNDIVVAALVEPTSTTDRAGIVKRLTPKGLASESTEYYETVRLENVDIRGVVIAVAKPISAQNVETKSFDVDEKESVLNLVQVELVLSDYQSDKPNLTAGYLSEVVIPYLESIEKLYEVTCEIKCVDNDGFVIKEIARGSLNFNWSFPDWFYQVLIKIFDPKKWDRIQTKEKVDISLTQSQIMGNNAMAGKIDAEAKLGPLNRELAALNVEKIKLDNFKVKFEVALDIVSALDPTLSIDIKRYYALQMIPHLEKILDGRLIFKSFTQVKRYLQ